MDTSFIYSVIKQLLAALPTTLGLFIVSIILGIIFSVCILLLRISRFSGFSLFGRAYIAVFRGTPLLIQMYLVYFGLAQLSIIHNTILWDLFKSPFICATISIACCTAAYTAEILRGGLRAIPTGLIEAGKALGMGPLQRTFLITIPLTLRQALPAYSTEAVMIVKSTALASLVTVLDVTGTAQEIIQETYRTMEVFICAAVIYLILNFVIIRFIAYLEKCLSPDIYISNMK